MPDTGGRGGGGKWSFVVSVLTCLLKNTPTNQVRLELKMLKKTNLEVFGSCFPSMLKTAIFTWGSNVQF